jgi:hypothetical protein
MNLLVDSLARYYAVISVCSKPQQELVVAYADEKSLRGLFAAPSIVALGYQSRAEADAYMDGNFQACCALPHQSKTRLSGPAQQRIAASGVQRTGKARFDVPNTRRKISHLVHYGLAVAIGLIYSQNFVSAILRSFVSF